MSQSHKCDTLQWAQAQALEAPKNKKGEVY